MLTAIVSRRCCQIALSVGSTFRSRSNSSMARVVVQQGELRGKLEKLSSGNTFASFKGIPYATPPVGKLRFKAPLPPVKWSGVRDATEHGGVCPQVDFVTGEIIEGNEDCLFLNVYSPSLNLKNHLSAVMVWFHGGGFISGSGDSDVYGPDHLIEEGVILVTVNYRLEALGYLCLDTLEVPGNAGMKDQVAALKWVKENISQFGGDPNNITAFGESAGGASATYHLVSPMSKGLVNKVIGQSGCFLNDWTICSKSRERAFFLGRLLGKDTNDTNELLDFFQGLPVLKLVKVTRMTMSEEEKNSGLPVYFGPTVEKDFGNRECFLPTSAKKFLENKNIENIPTLLGYNNKEGISIVKDTLRKAKAVNADFERKVPRHIVERVTEVELREIANKIKHFYFGKKEISAETYSEIIDLETDNNFSVGIIQLARTLGQFSAAPVYLYRFSVDGELNVFKKSLGLGEYSGASHADDLFYLFKIGIEVHEGSDTWRALRRMVKLWTNFAKYGNPTPKTDDLIDVNWPPVTKTSLNFLDIGLKLLTPGQDPDKARFELWKNIFKSVYDKKPFKSQL